MEKTEQRDTYHSFDKRTLDNIKKLFIERDLKVELIKSKRKTMLVYFQTEGVLYVSYNVNDDPITVMHWINNKVKENNYCIKKG